MKRIKEILLTEEVAYLKVLVLDREGEVLQTKTVIPGGKEGLGIIYDSRVKTLYMECFDRKSNFLEKTVIDTTKYNGISIVKTNKNKIFNRGVIFGASSVLAGCCLKVLVRKFLNK